VKTTGAGLADPRLTAIVYSEERISERVADLGREIAGSYSEEDNLLLLGFLKGSFIFLADLVRAIDLPHQIDFLMAASYGSDRVSSGDVKLLYDPEADLAGRSVIVVEDIVDSGNTVNRVVPLLESRGPRSLELCTLLQKRPPRLVKQPRWVGFDAPDVFLVGYGLDCDENFRHLPYIASL
jgi:hypoxanthine phosphoribosyltransferase